MCWIRREEKNVEIRIDLRGFVAVEGGGEMYGTCGESRNFKD
jgi:hypothetical protein